MKEIKFNGMKKKVKFNGETFTITFEDFAFRDSRFVINGESSSIIISNDTLINLETLKKYVRQSIQEYIHRRNSKKQFKNWDGKL